MKKQNTALESIQFQKTELFDSIVNCIKNIKKLDKNIIDVKYYATAEINQLTEVIKKYTGITFEFVNGNGPAVYIPRLAQTIFDSSEDLQRMSSIRSVFDINYDLKKILKSLDGQVIQGTVDLKNSKVTGLFSQIKCKMFLPKTYINGFGFSDEEIAAVILHELGHVFTSFEYLSRSVQTNQSLSIMLRMMDDTVSFEDRKIVFNKAKSKLKLDSDAYKLIEDENSKERVTMVVINESIQKSKSELGESVYDVVSCEYLADQFAARHGAGKYLVTALDKILRTGRGSDSFSYFAALMGVVILLGITPLPASIGLITIISVAFTTITSSYIDVNNVYDNDYMRLSRVKHQMIQRLKSPDILKDEKETIISYLEEVDPIINKYINDNNVKLRNRIAFFFSSKHKRDFEYMNLQKDLELIGNNDLYVMSEKLKMI